LTLTLTLTLTFTFTFTSAGRRLDVLTRLLREDARRFRTENWTPDRVDLLERVA